MNEKIIENAKLKYVAYNKNLLEGMEIKYRIDGYLKESQKLYEAVNK